jgi:putative endonuclease
MKRPAVYILASQKDGTLYVGVTSNLPQRIWQHKNHQAEGFTKKYNVTTLVYFEQAETMESAIAREKALKKFSRDAKIKLIEINNPDWLDLYERIIG